jgi:hypothetical protein
VKLVRKNYMRKCQACSRSAMLTALTKSKVGTFSLLDLCDLAKCVVEFVETDAGGG